MNENSSSEMVLVLPEPVPRWRAMSAGFAVECVAVALLASITIALPPVARRVHVTVPLVAPDLSTAVKLAPPPRPRIVPPSPARLEQIAPPRPQIAPKIQAPQLAEVRPPVVAPAPAPAPKFDSPVVDKPAGPKIPESIKTDVFAGRSATPTVHKPAHQVQTGGFGDPNGVPPNPNAHGAVQIAQVGSFDLPAGAGHGNGSGGAHGARGTVASAGFGNGIATEGGQGGRGSGAQGKVQLAAFGDASAPVAEKHVATLETPATKPVAIESKPQPVYTAEARKLGIQGEVLLRVIFTAAGVVQVQNVVRGLGHGLDEAAVRAAQGIRFKPAERDGRAVDSNATLHIVFQLS